MDHIIRQGLSVKLKGVPLDRIESGPAISTVAVMGRDFAHIRPKMLVKVGDKVALGQPLFCDFHRPEIVVTAPASGEVINLKQSNRQSFDKIEIRSVGADRVQFPTSSSIRETLLVTGLWSRLTTRPFGFIPDSGAIAEAILVTAIDTNPLALDPTPVLAECAAEFERGLEALADLGCGPVIVCQSSDTPALHSNGKAIRCARFKGRHPAGLPGTHLDRLGLADKPIWQIGYQDVISIGRVFLTGFISGQRYVALGGPMASNPRILRTLEGANLQQLLQGECHDGEVEVISGSVLSGRVSDFLGRKHTQVSLLPAIAKNRRRNWFSGKAGNQYRPMLATEALERVLPKNILPVPLMRALAVGDWEAARYLGAANLLEEDLALLTYLCSSGTDYGALLRLALDDYAGVNQRGGW